MERQSRGRRLLVALLVIGVSSGLGALPTRHAGASVSLGGSARSGDARAWSGQGAQVRPGRWQPRSGTALPGWVSRTRLAGLVATSPVTWTQQSELTSTAQTPNDAFGADVAVSGDTAVVGASNTPFFSDYGAAYIFGRSGSTWTQQADLSDPAATPNDQFGYSVAVSGDTAVIGAPVTTEAAAASGAAYVYVRSGGTWTLQATLTATDGAFNDELGNSVAISGSTIVIGAWGKDGGRGAVYLFGRVGGVWQQQAEFLGPTNVPNAELGYAVAVSGDTAVASAVQEPVAFVYARSGGIWALQALLHAAHAPGLYFGTSVALSGDTAMVGACCDVLGRQAGAVYVFGRSGSTWTLRATIPPAAGTDANLFGTAVALSGPNAIISGVGDYAYAGQGSTWAEQGELIPSDRPPYDLSGAVAVSGNTALVGATGTMGAAYVFVRSRVGSQAPTADDSGMALRPAPRGRVR